MVCQKVCFRHKIIFSMVVTCSNSEDDKEMECNNNPSYDVMRLHRPTLTGHNERENISRVSGTYASVN